MNVVIDQELDVKGLHCPLPLLRAKKALAGMQSGQILRVLATDPSVDVDFKVYAAKTGHELLVCEERDGVVEFVLRKA